MSYNVTKIHIYQIPGCGCKTFICFMLSIDIATRTKSDVPVQEEIVRIFVENYSLFVGINAYLPQIIVRIFVDFD